jgi:hypothetical protein
MPFKEELNPVLDAIREAVDRASEGLRCVRLDDLRHAGRITDDLARAIESAKVCIADLSGMNPNVMWEIGFAMSREKPMILLAQETDNLPFDIRDFRIIRYDLPTARKSLPPEIILALRETSKIYQWHARANQPDNSGDTVARGKSWLGTRTLRISLSISFLALLAVSSFLWSTVLTSRHTKAQLLEASAAISEAELRLRRAQESLRACTPSRYRYQYERNDRQCDGFFEKKDGVEWVEYTPGDNGCIATEYHFTELGQEDGWLIIHDPDRGFFVRLPVRGKGPAQLASSRTGPWGLLRVVERADIP